MEHAVALTVPALLAITARVGTEEHAARPQAGLQLPQHLRQYLAGHMEQHLSLIHISADMARPADLNPAGKPMFSYDPPIGYQWPLRVGKQWTSTHMVTLHNSGSTVPLTINWKVESWGDVTVPAGTFKAYKLVWTNNLGEVETRWANPQEGLMTIKRHVERPGSHPQGPGVLDAELLTRVLPAR